MTISAQLIRGFTGPQLIARARDWYRLAYLHPFETLPDPTLCKHFKFKLETHPDELIDLGNDMMEMSGNNYQYSKRGQMMIEAGEMLKLARQMTDDQVISKDGAIVAKKLRPRLTKVELDLAAGRNQIKIRMDDPCPPPTRAVTEAVEVEVLALPVDP